MRPNLTKEEKEHYNKVAMDMIYKSKTPRTDKAEPKIQFIKGGWVRADFARELEIELNELKNELDNSKFGAQCTIHELEYDKKVLIEENEELKEEIEEKDKNIKELISIAEEFYYDVNGLDILIVNEIDKLYERLLRIKKTIDLS